MNKTENKYFCVKVTYKDYGYKFDLKYSDKVLNDYIVYEIGENFNEKLFVKEALRLYLKKEFSKSRKEREVFRNFYEKYKDIFDSVSMPVYDKGDVVTLRSTVNDETLQENDEPEEPPQSNSALDTEIRSSEPEEYTYPKIEEKIEEMFESLSSKLDEALGKQSLKLYEAVEQQSAKSEKSAEMQYTKIEGAIEQQEKLFAELIEQQNQKIDENFENLRLRMDEIVENQRLAISRFDKFQRDFEDFEYKFEGIEKAIDNIKKIIETVESIPDADSIREIIDDVTIVPPSDSNSVGEAKKIIVDLVSQLAAGTDEYIKKIKETSEEVN